MLQDIDVIAWDFDGVLNRNVVNDRFEWVQKFEEDFGVSWTAFAKEVFSGEFEEILVGAVDLKEAIARWAAKVNYGGDPDDFLSKWFERDAHPDEDVLAVMEQLSGTRVRQIIATNNERYRVRFIEEHMGYKDRVEAVYASGRMGVAKPNAEFFMQITSELGIPAPRMLLIDDREENIVSARDMGWKALHFTPQSRKHIIKALGA